MIRQLRPGEPIPNETPRRYRASHGYIRLRWRISKGHYVETYEHRVVDGRVSTAEHVHHINGVRDDNRPENLEPVTSSEHRLHHRLLDHDLIVSLYLDGLSTIEVGKRVGCNPGTVSRVLADRGVSARPTDVQIVHVDLDELRRLHATPGMNSSRIARQMGMRVGVIRARMKDLGLAPFPPGRPRSLAKETHR